MKTEYKQLVSKALQMRAKAYAPYSGFHVGAALLSADGLIYTGCNIENAAYTPSNCAERTAFFKAISEGVYDFKAIAIVGGARDADKLDYCAPCGVCRQVMMEFCKDDFEVILARSETEYEIYTLAKIMPMGFGPKNLEKET